MLKASLRPPAPDSQAPCLPPPRGPLSSWLCDVLRRPPGEVGAWPAPQGDPVVGEDRSLTLYLLYELHYRGLRGVDDRWEWAPPLLALRAELEGDFLAELREALPAVPVDDVPAALTAVVDSDPGPSLSLYMAQRGSLREFAEFAMHRSAYQLKEADPHTWAIPRLAGEAKAALVDIQYDEYGRGDAGRMHAPLFARTLASLGLDSAYGAHLPRLPGVTLATVNLVSMFGLHRSLRGALVGHLAIFEMASVVPNGRYADALVRLGRGSEAAEFYRVHVEADEIHQKVARDQMAGALAQAEPAVSVDILFGARAIMRLERRFADHLLGSWAEGRSSLLPDPGPLR